MWQDGGACCGGGGSASRTRGRSKALPSPYPGKARSLQEHAVQLNFSLYSVRLKFDKWEKMQNINCNTTPTCFLQKSNRVSGQINSTEPFKISVHPDELETL